MERVKGIEPSSLGWEPRALPLSYTRLTATPSETYTFRVIVIVPPPRGFGQLWVIERTGHPPEVCPACAVGRSFQPLRGPFQIAIRFLVSTPLWFLD
jgi:hypothetical protein